MRGTAASPAPGFPPANRRNETACGLIHQSVRIRPPKFGAVVQLVRIPACHAGGRGFESRPLRQILQPATTNMLQRIGDSLKGQKWLAYLVLGALALVFAAWGAYGVVNLSFGGSNYAAEADGSKISLEEARNAWLRQQTQWQQRLGGADIPPELRSKLQDQVLEGLISKALLTQRTLNLGYRVSQDALREAVHSEQAFQVGGQYSPEAAKAALAQAGVSLQAYEDDLRTSVQRVQLEGGIRASDFLTPLELTRLTDLEDQEREVRYLVLPADRFKSAASVDDAAVQAYYQAHQAQYMTPESAHLQYAELRLEALAAQQPVSDADLHAAYEKNRSEEHTSELQSLRHLVCR